MLVSFMQSGCNYKPFFRVLPFSFQNVDRLSAPRIAVFSFTCLFTLVGFVFLVQHWLEPVYSPAVTAKRIYTFWIVAFGMMDKWVFLLKWVLSPWLHLRLCADSFHRGASWACFIQLAHVSTKLAKESLLRVGVLPHL